MNILKPSSILCSIEAWTCLFLELAMAVDPRPGELVVQLTEEHAQGELLLRCACVLGLVVTIKTTDVADTYGVLVVPEAMGTHLLQRSAMFQVAIEVYDVVIATAIPPLLAVPAVDVGKAVVLALLRCTTMKDDFRYLSHGFVD